MSVGVFFLSTLLFMLLFGIIHYLGMFLLGYTFLPVYYVFYLLFFILSLAGFITLKNITRKNSARFIPAYMGYLVAKIFFSFGGLIVYIMLYREKEREVILSFFIVYLFFLSINTLHFFRAFKR